MGSWTSVSFDGQQIQPPSRGGHASASLGDKLICFGGADRTPTPFGTIWALQSDGPGDQGFQWRRSMPVSSTGQELLPRVGASMSAIGDKIYLFGGQDPQSGDCHSDVILMDTVTWHWVTVEVPGVRPPSRHSHCAAVLGKGVLVVFGGAGSEGILGDLWLFDTQTRIWSHPKTLGLSPSPREMHIGCEISAHQLLVYGGRSATSQVLDDAAIFDLRSMTWQGNASTGFPRCSHTAVAVPSWWVEGLQQPSLDASEQGDAVVIAFAGYSGQVEDSMVCIDPGSMRARLLSAQREGSPAQGIPKPRFAHTMAVMHRRSPNMALVIFGGVNSDEDLHDVAVWRPHSSQASSTLIRTESEILIQKPEGLPMTLAETIDPSVFTGSSGGQVLPLEPPTATSHPSTAQIIPPAPQLGDLLSSPPALDPSQQIKLAAGARTSEDMSDATAALS